MSREPAIAAAPANAMASPSRARGPSTTAPASPRQTTTAPAAATRMPSQARRDGGSPASQAPPPPNSGEQVTSTADEATVVNDSDALNSAKCTASSTPASTSRLAARAASGTPARPTSANGASTTAPARQRQNASASAGRWPTRTRIGDDDTATTPRIRPILTVD